MSKIELGQKVSISACVEVQKPWRRGDRGVSRRFSKVPMKAEGIIVGMRTSPEGWTENLYGDGLVFHPTGYKRLMLVAISMQRIVRAFPEDVTVLP